jgi:sugar O-acyltransferase (sialic acid O-acetyltransferase NeuD family)
MTKKSLIIIGSSGHAKVVLDIFEKMNLHEIIGFIDNNKQTGEIVLGYPVLGDEEFLNNHKSEHTQLFIAIGDNCTRQKVRDRIKTHFPEFSFATAIHPSATIGKEVKIGQGSAIMAGSIINPCCIIGEFCLINTKASLDHDSVMNDFSSLAPGVTTGGNVEIGASSAVGIGASIMHGVKIGTEVVIGGHSFVNKNVDDFSVCYGVPAKSIRKRVVGEKYL